MKNVYDISEDRFAFTGDLQIVCGNPEKFGIWIISGPEKNGKTTGALMLANYFSTMERTLYVSGEEGIRGSFKMSCKRANINSDSKLQVIPYEPIAELKERLKRRKAAKVVFIDNLTTYNTELKGGGIAQLTRELPDVVFVFIAHMEKGELTTAAAKLCRRLSDIIIEVSGLTMTVSGRCPGGELIIDEEKAALYHGQKQTA